MKKRERTCKKHYLTETYPQVTLRLCKQRSGESSWYHCLVSTRTQVLWPPEHGHSSRGSHVASLAMLCLRLLDGNAHRAVYFLITRGRESSRRVQCHSGDLMTLEYISGKCHHHHCQHGNSCRRGLGDLP